MNAIGKINLGNRRIGAIARSQAKTNRPFCVLIRNVRLSSSVSEPQWRVLKRTLTRQEASKIVKEHQSDPLHARRFQYRIA